MSQRRVASQLPEDGIIDQVALDRVVRDRLFTPMTPSESVIAANLLSKRGVVIDDIAELLRCNRRTVDRYIAKGFNLEWSAA